MSATDERNSVQSKKLDPAVSSTKRSRVVFTPIEGLFVGTATNECYTGTFIDLLLPDPNDVHIMDIATHLSRICRFNGATFEFYSVAEHSVLVSDLLEYDRFSPIVQLSGLLHDAHETYLGDLATPVKRLLGASYPSLRQGMDVAIATRFALPYDFSEEMHVVAADQRILAIEAYHLMVSSGEGEHWARLPKIDLAERVTFKPRCYVPNSAKRLFLERYNHLVTQVHKTDPTFPVQYAL